MEKVIYSLLMLCFLQICKGQKMPYSEYISVIVIKKDDKNYEFSKKKYDKGYLLLVYHTKNIAYNKKYNLKYDTLEGGRVVICNKCKRERIIYSLVKSKLPEKVKYYTLHQLIYGKERIPNMHDFGGGGFLIDGIYYRSLQYFPY